MHFPVGASARCFFEVDLGNISHNAREIQRMASACSCKVMGIIKANAYGHGSVAVSHMLNRVNGIDFFGVATLNEGIEVRVEV